MSEYVYAGLTSQTIDVFLRDSSSASGAGLTGLVFNSSGLKAYYRKGATGSAVQITLATQTTGGAWTSGGFVAVDGTNLPGIYRLDLPDAMVDTEGFVTLHIYGATNLQPTPLRIDCRPLPADLKKIAGSAVNTGAAQLGVNVVSYASGQAPPASSVIADAVLDEMISQHLTPGSLGWAINLIRKANTTIDGTVAASPAPTTTTFKLTGADYPTGAMQHSVLFFEEGTANIELQNSPILTWTNNGDTTVTVVLEEPLTNAPQAGDVVLILPQSHVHAIADIQAGLSTLTAGQVNTEVVDALSVDTYAEPTAVPAATSSLKDKLNWLFMLARNRLTQTPTTQTVFRDDTTTPAATSTVSDNGTTATRGEFQ